MSKAPAHAIERFQKNRLGMFIHFGLYSLLNRRETVMHDQCVPEAEYRLLADRFQPAEDAVEGWVRMAKECQMRYACLTTRHGDGFALFDTPTTDFNSVKSAAGRDLVREFVDACRAHDIRPTLYYSVGNWTDPGFRSGPKKDPGAWKNFVERAQTQLKELMSNYGPIDYLFYDGCPPAELWDGEKMNAELRKLQPDLLISDRCGLDEDVASSENRLNPHQKPWECCMTTNNSWGCNKGDPDYKSLYSLIRNFFCCVHNGGNFLLNAGPLADGSISLAERSLFEGLGEWVDRNREAVFETLPDPFQRRDKKLSCYRDQTVYSALHWYHGPDTALVGIGNQVLKVRLLATGREIAFRQEGSRVVLEGLPIGPPDILPVIAVELDGPPKPARNPYDSGCVIHDFEEKFE